MLLPLLGLQMGRDGQVKNYVQHFMVQFIALPDGTFVVVNGGHNDNDSYTEAIGQPALLSNMASANLTD